MNDSPDSAAQTTQLPPIADDLSATIRSWIVTAYMATTRWQRAIADGDLETASKHFDKMAHYWSKIVSQADAEAQGKDARQYICARCHRWFSEREYADPGAIVCAPDDQDERPHRREDLIPLGGL